MAQARKENPAGVDALGGAQNDQARNKDHNEVGGEKQPDACDGAKIPDEVAIEFLRWLRPEGPWTLTAIVPDGPTTTTKTFIDPDKAREFIVEHEGRQNLYYSVNPLKREMRTKASKKDIKSANFIFADLDPRNDETPEQAKTRYTKALQSIAQPSAVIDSGNGIQALWRLDQPVEPDQSDEPFADIEARTLALTLKLGGTAGTQNADRILRLPGTTNLPNKKKLRDGRVSCKAKLIKFNGNTHPLSAFEASETFDQPSASTTPGIDWDLVAQHLGWLKSVADLPDDFSIKGKTIIAHSGNLGELKFDLERVGMLTKPYQSWSEVSLALTAIFKSDGRYNDEQIAAALMADLECNQHITKLTSEAKQRRAIERLILRSHSPTHQMHAAGVPNWRERRDKGHPAPSMHNARLAIQALGVECSYDKFHNKLLFGYKNDNTRHVVEQVLGDEVSDHGIIALRQLMSDAFGFDLTDKHTRDAVTSLALQHCFNPVLDMLAEAKANWDGVKRLDRMAVDYFNCEDTRLNATYIRKTMIAAVARVRIPGIKHDEITVLESEEGLNKSTAWRVLAGDENFSDERLLGKESREIQEHLAEIWIHENADLAGMKKADVDSVKAHASRQVDIARPAWGHFLKKQKRHSIEVGSTNSDRYLQSQTGNRRFWSLKVLKIIDIDKLRRDRLQLWGEAAHYHSQRESLVLPEELWGEAGEQQEYRRVTDSWEDALCDISHKTANSFSDTPAVVYHDPATNEDKVAADDIFKFVLDISPGHQQIGHSMRLANVMKHLGWQRTTNGYLTINGRRVRGYFRLTPAKEDP
jgi:predicted P-loop ATPase